VCCTRRPGRFAGRHHATSAEPHIDAFSDLVAKPAPFPTTRRPEKKINKLIAAGETALFDAIFQALQTLEAERAHGKRAVVVLNRRRRTISAATAGRRVSDKEEKHGEPPCHLLAWPVRRIE